MTTNDRSQLLTAEQLSAIECVLREGASGDELDFYGISLLHESCRDNRTDLVTRLLSAGCDVSFVDRAGLTPIHYAVKSGNLDLVSSLVQNGARVSAEGFDPGIKLDICRSKSPTPLSVAAKMDRIDLVRYLMQNGAGEHNEQVTEAFRVALDARSIGISRAFKLISTDRMTCRLCRRCVKRIL